MPKRATPLTAAKMRTAGAGTYVDGNGLMLLVRAGQPDAAGKVALTRSWVLRYSFGGKRRHAGLGRAGEGADHVTLAEARQIEAEWHRKLRTGVDPLAERDAEEARRRAEAQAVKVNALTFRDVAKLYIAAHEAAWRNAKHAYQWRATLETYAFPYMGDVPVRDVATGHVMAALEPIWRTKPETATRLRGRIESVLAYAGTSGWREGENPARWRGHVDNLLPRRSKVAAVKHHAALAWGDVPAFLVALAERETGSTAALPLRFTILTAARSGEVLGARWSEIDLTEAVWTVPATRMKAGREHRVPLSAAALDVLQRAAALRTNDGPEAFVFPGQKSTKPFSITAMIMVLRRMGRGDLTVHGFRSSFRDWAGETRADGHDVIEAALAHTIKNKAEAAYARSDLLAPRRRLMEAWAKQCATVPPAEGATVTTLRRRAG
jgi:integrase